jgi:hypothetical protein
MARRRARWPGDWRWRIPDPPAPPPAPPGRHIWDDGGLWAGERCLRCYERREDVAARPCPGHPTPIPVDLREVPYA